MSMSIHQSGSGRTKIEEVGAAVVVGGLGQTRRDRRASLCEWPFDPLPPAPGAVNLAAAQRAEFSERSGSLNPRMRAARGSRRGPEVKSLPTVRGRTGLVYRAAPGRARGGAGWAAR